MGGPVRMRGRGSRLGYEYRMIEDGTQIIGSFKHGIYLKDRLHLLF